MESALNKSERLAQLEQLLIAYPQGLKRAEIARRLGVNRSTVGRYIDELSGRHDSPVPIYDDDGLIKINRDKYLNYIGLTVHEAMAVHLATRLMATRTDRHNPYAASALRKLGNALETFAPLISRHVLASANVMDDAARRQDANYVRTLEVLTRAWSDRQRVRIWHRYEDNGNVYKYDFAPYFIEPYAIGQTTHVIGHRRPPDAIRTFKLERIERIELLNESYTIPADFDPQARLADAWGIWYTDAAPVEVQLKFHRNVARRVKETQWHRSEDLTELPDGSLIWRAKIAEPKEMLPWIRGWGADCEVIEPERLREALKKTTINLGNLYQTITTMTKLHYHLPYAKTNPDNKDEIHLLLYHLIDVGQVALLMWHEVLTDSIRRRLANMLNLEQDEAGQFIAFLAALHDIGKAFPGYQKKYGPDWLLKEMNEAGFQLYSSSGEKAFDKTFPHGTVSTWALITLLPEQLKLDRNFANKIAIAIGGHHGSWPAPGATDRLETESEKWDALRRDLFWEVQAVFRPPSAAAPPANKNDMNIFLTIFSGLVSVADWLGSRNKECFGFVEQAMPTRQYVLRSLEKARESLADLGWFGWRPTGQTHLFGEVFAYLNFEAPHSVQAKVIESAQNLPAPSLLILEAPTGIGKTETALYLADSWLQQNAGRGLYVAMPTQATSNQMYGRIGDFLDHRYPDTKINYHLVHGQAAWQDKFKKRIELQTVGDDKDRTTAVQAESWFTPRKRTLLAPFGVGTVDQTFMSILQTRHFFVRLFGLSHKVIIFDEVHAYDTFMSTLFERLLTWLNAIGASVIILSATLPAETRRRLVEAYSGKTLTQSGEYPSLTIGAPNSEPTLIELPKPDNVIVQLDWDVGREPDDILGYLQEKLANGGCAAVICNTVRRAQDIYRALDGARQAGALNILKDDLLLFHARFPPVWRKDIEQKVLAKFGKPDKDNPTPRPHKAIVVATQVIEQSLDLDFDLMLTDLAPVDLIIQRAGRLHRHQRSAEERHNLPRRLVIIPPEMGDDAIPQFKRKRDVYEPYVLLRSFYALKAQGDVVTFPSATTPLIEQVYGDISLLQGVSDTELEAIKAAEKEMKKREGEARQKAKGQLILAPGKSRLLKQSIAGLDEDNPEIHKTFRAQTRDIDTGISLICLHQKDGRTFIYTESGELEINMEEEAPFQQLKYLQQNTITVQHKTLFYHFLNQELPPAWQKQAALRHYRTVIFEEGQYTKISKYTLKLNRTFGLEIIKQEDV